MKKRIVSFSIVLSLVYAMTATAFAASFDFHFTPPFTGSLNTTGLQEVTQLDAAYVNPSTSATPTTYYLATSSSNTIAATDFIKDVSTSGKRSFTYKTNYGGIGTKYKLGGYPSNFDFLEYDVEGTWSP